MTDWDEISRLPLTYAERGATASALPGGYRHILGSQPIGHSRRTFDAAAARLFGWEMHRRAGITVRASGPPEPGSDVIVGFGPFAGACRVIYVVTEPNRRGFAYGTLAGHPESGEEYFGVRLDPADDAVYAEIVAFSRPGRWWTTLASQPAALVQRHITRRYLDALRPTP